MTRRAGYEFSLCTRGPRAGIWILHAGNCREAGWSTRAWSITHIDVVGRDTAERHALRLARIFLATARLDCPDHCLDAA